MLDPAWIATALGLAGGAALTYALAKIALPRVVGNSRDPLLCLRLALAGTVVAAVPALVLSLVLGGTLGGALGKQLSQQAGLGASGALIGVALGSALVFALVMLAGIGAGILLGQAVLLVRRTRAAASKRAPP